VVRLDASQADKQGRIFHEQWLKSLDLAPKTKGNIRNVMAVIFNWAMRWGLIDLVTNPVSLVGVKGVSRRQKEPRILNSAEIRTLIERLKEPCRTTVIVALGTGLRCSELFALRWLRHADVRTTINVYTQAVSEQKCAAHSRVVQMVPASEG
jgi:integrase